MPAIGLSPFYENAAGRLFEHPDGYVVFAYHPGKRLLPDLQALIARTAQQLQHNGWHRILGDQRLMTALAPEESAWLVAFWQEEARRRGTQLYAGVILAQDVFARLAAHPLGREVQSAAITYRAFPDVAAAENWLRQMQ